MPRRPQYGNAATAVLFMLLAITVTMSVATVFGDGAAAVQGSWAEILRVADCVSPIIAKDPSPYRSVPLSQQQIDSTDANVAALRACMAPLIRQLTQGMLLGAVLVLLLAFALYLLHPLLIARIHRLRVPDREDAAALVAELDRLRRLAGVSRPVAFRVQPFALAPSAFVFGLPGRRCLVVSGGLVVRMATDPAAFRAVVLHELAHLRNRDVDFTYGALAFTGAFALLDGGAAFAGGVYSALSSGADLLVLLELAVKTLGLLVVALTLTAAIVRSRELNADARVRDWGEEGAALERVLAALPTPARRRLRLHPAPATRLAALRTAIPPFGSGLGSGMAIAVACGIGGYSLELMADSVARFVIVPRWGGAVTGALLAVGIVTGRWRTAGSTGRAAPDLALWRFGTGLAAGLALDLVLQPAYPEVTIARPAALAVWIVVWVPLVALVAGPLTVWLARATEAVGASVERAGWRGRREGAVLAAVILPAGTAFAQTAADLHSKALTTFPDLGATGGQVWSEITDPALLGAELVHSWTIPVLLSCTAFIICLAATAYALHRLRRARLPERSGGPSTGAGTAWKANLREGLRGGLIGAGAVVVLVLVASFIAHREPMSDRWDAAAYLHFLHLLVACSDALVVLTALLTAGRAPGALVRGSTAALTASAAATLALILQPSAGGCAQALGVAAVSPDCLSITSRSVSFMTDYVGAVSLLLSAVLLPHSVTACRWIARSGSVGCPTTGTAPRWSGTRPWRLTAVGLAALCAVGFVRLGRPNLILISDSARVEAVEQCTFLMPPGWFVADTGRGPSDPELQDPSPGWFAELELQAHPSPAPAPEIAIFGTRMPYDQVTANVPVMLGAHHAVSIRAFVVGGHRAVSAQYGAGAGYVAVIVDTDPGALVITLQAEPGSSDWDSDEADLKRLLATLEFRF
ncbi:M48 family metalloprotease [Kitasatospora sp. RB6PN24]|uniref:M48 family metalloprotease n=1 Tax=Kitasatospora humi TaxID=2893891 RepID=UPI001E4987DB|nr:M48 family metalloprotease [Kitasatospora humi]MCC9305872.1 M48 family metalloprotease [Kitasatospora humi]